MRELELALEAAADPMRTRILKLLERGPLCVCQVQAVLGLAPSTVSRHLAPLKSAHLVEDQRSGKWIAYRLTREPANPHAKPVLALLRAALERDPAIRRDRLRLREVKRVSLESFCSVYPAHSLARSPSTRRRKEPPRA